MREKEQVIKILPNEVCRCEDYEIQASQRYETPSDIKLFHIEDKGVVRGPLVYYMQRLNGATGRA